MWQRRGEFLLHDNSQSLPILAILLISMGAAGAWGLQEHGGVRGEARFPPGGTTL